MIYAPARRRGTLLDEYCLQLGTLVERRHTELALVAARQQAETAAVLANEAMLQAQAADRAKTSFLASMTHELRTPLNAIIGFSEIIGEVPARPGNDHAEYARYIHDAGKSLLAMVNGVLDLARIEAGKLELEEQPIPLDEVIGAAVAATRAAAAAKQIVIDCAPAPPRPLLIDPLKIKQVFVNLLSNAIQFSAADSRISITSTHSRDGDVVVAVADTGAGIAREHLALVLEPFGQIEDPLTRQHNGPGLGLPIARALVLLHGGELALASEPGCGTTVTVRLPGSRVCGPDEPVLE